MNNSNYTNNLQISLDIIIHLVLIYDSDMQDKSYFAVNSF